MSIQRAKDDLGALLREAGPLHHAAFAATDGEDPEWPLWYAAHLKPLLGDSLAAEMTESRLVHCLVELDDEHSDTESDEPWQSFYATRLVERYGAAPAPSTDVLALYYFEHCPYCRRVLAVIDELGLDIERRDILSDEGYRMQLIEGTGRSTVPVLHITSTDGTIRWMPESADIASYLRATYNTAAPG